VEDLVYEEEGNRYRCPVGKERTCKGQVQLNRNSGEQYQAKSSDGKDCQLRQRCIVGRGGKRPKRTLYIGDRDRENRREQLREKRAEAKWRVVYGRRMQIIEPCFSDMSYCTRMDWFSLRTKIQVTIQWLRYGLEHTIGKCIPGIATESMG
jgi:hypothetical protein